MFRSWALAGPFALLVALPFTAAGCRPDADAAERRPLFDADHRPDVLVETRRLESPPSPDGNRFLLGWRPGKGKSLVTDGSAAGDRVRVELVSLDDRPRTLVLEGELGSGPSAVTIGGRPLAAATPVEGRLTIELPAGLPLGRQTVELETPPATRWRVEAGGVRPALPAGLAEVDGADLHQSGWSRVDVVRPLAGQATLVGRFVPPLAPRPDQRFALEIETDGAPPRRVFEWSGGFVDRMRGERELSVALREDGFVRFRFVAQGEGDPAKWTGFALAGGEVEPEVVDPTPPAPPRLVLLHIFDALRGDHVGHLGSSRGLTPTIDRFAAEGVAFTHHISVAPNTLPSTLALFYGRTVRTKRGLSVRGPGTLAAAITARGVLAAAFSENGNVSPALRMTQGFDHVETASMMEDEKVLHWSDPSNYNYSSERGHQGTLRWLEGLDPATRAFVYTHVVNPHNPYAPPQPLVERYVETPASESTIDASTPTLLAINRQRQRASAADRARIRELYAASVAYADTELDRFTRALAERFAPGEVLLILTADHGDELFEHDGLLHGYTLYEDQLRIPLVFWWPGVLAPARIEAATDHLDLHATLRALYGAPATSDGQSLWPLLLARSQRGKSIRMAAASAVAGGIFMARSDRYKLIWAPQSGQRWGQGVKLGRSRDPEYVFDLAGDPGEQVNLAGTDVLEIAWLRERLRAWVDAGRSLEAAAETEKITVDEETKAQLRALGYAAP